jgi:hypothetical protein
VFVFTVSCGDQKQVTISRGIESGQMEHRGMPVALTRFVMFDDRPALFIAEDFITQPFKPSKFG